METGAGTAVVDYKQTALHLAARNGDRETLQLLLEYSADVSAKTETGETALHLVTETTHKPMAVLLLQNRADVVARNNSGETALHWTVRGASQVMVAFLIDRAGADIAAKTNSRETALHWAANHGIRGWCGGCFTEGPTSRTRTMMERQRCSWRRGMGIPRWSTCCCGGPY